MSDRLDLKTFSGRIETSITDFRDGQASRSAELWLLHNAVVKFNGM